MNKELKELNKQIAKLQKQIYEIETQEKIKENKKLIGKYFKYDNGYNSEKRWWLYRKITGVTKESYFKTIEFEITFLNEINIKEKSSCTWHDSSWIEITEEEFLEAWFKCFVAVKNLNNKL